MIYRITNDGHKHAHLVRNREELMALRNSIENLDNLEKARHGDAEAKKHLVQFAYNLGHVDGALAGCKSIGSFFFHDIDCYGNEELREKNEELKDLILSKKEEIGLMMLERSASGGYHLVCKRVPGTTILENQVRIATILQIEMDTSTKDLQRVVFSTSGSPEDLVYLDDKLFTEPMTPEECVQEYNRLKVRVMRKQENVPDGAKKANKHYRPWEDDSVNSKFKIQNSNDSSQPENNSQFSTLKAAIERGENQTGLSSSEREQARTKFNSQFVDERVKFIAKGVMKEKGLEENDFLNEGGRHTTVKIFLGGATQLLTKEEVNGVLKELMPDHWNDENIQQLVNDFYQNYTNPNQRLLKYQEQLFTQSQRLFGSEELRVKSEESLPSGSREGVGISSQMEGWGKQIEDLFADYPILSDLCKGLKKNQYPAALFVGGGLLMTLMTRCTYRFYHRPEELRRLNNSTIIVGDPACGKSFATRLYKLLAEPIIRADEEGKKAINAYRELIKSKGANKDKPQKPKVVVRVHPARTSNAQFIQDMVNAVEKVDGEDMQLHMLTFDTELDNTVSVQRGGSWIDKLSMELKAFHNEEDGQAYSNADSVMQDFSVFWNYIYTGTPTALKKKVNAQNFGTGLATRLTCIPLPKTNFRMMSRESTVDYESDQRLRDWAYKLDRMKGELPLQKIVDELYEWTARRMADAEENQSEADEMLLKRCAYHGLNFSAPFIVMRHWDKMQQDGQYWCGEFETDEVDWKLAELIVNIQYACQRHFFGKLAENYFVEASNEANVNMRRQQKTFEGFERLPEEFTLEDVMRCFKLSTDGAARSRTRRLEADHLVKKINDARQNGTSVARYRKTGTTML